MGGSGTEAGSLILLPAAGLEEVDTASTIFNTTTNLTVDQVLTSIYINVTIGVICIVGFSLIYRRQIFGLSQFFAPRKKAVDNPIDFTFWKGLVSWIWQSLR